MHHHRFWQQAVAQITQWSRILYTGIVSCVLLNLNDLHSVSLPGSCCLSARFPVHVLWSLQLVPVHNMSPVSSACRLTYEERAGLAKNSVAKQCLEIMARKKTNLAVAADVATADEMLRLAEQTGPHICVFKTHVDIFDR